MRKDILLMGALGNSLGLPYEFDNGPFDLSTFKGHRDDDIAQALMLAETIIQCNGEFNPQIFLDKLLAWYEHGYDSLTNYAEGLGNQTRSILEKAKFNKDFKPRLIDMSGKHLDGNGSLMRVGPEAMKLSRGVFGFRQSQVTHNTDLCNYSCEFFAVLLNEMCYCHSKQEGLGHTIYMFDRDGLPLKLVELLIREDYLKPIEKPSGYVIDTLHAVLYTFMNTNTAMEGFKYIINLGGDTDTTACIYGYLAGAYYGIDEECSKLIEKIKDVDYIKYLSRKLLQKFCKGEYERCFKEVSI